MAEFQVHVCNGITGARIDTIPASDFSYSRLLSAGGDGSVTVPLDGSFTSAQLDSLLAEWQNIIVLERDGKVEYAGYVKGESDYTRGSSKRQVPLTDLWGLLENRLAVDHSVSNVENWAITVSGNLATHANQILIWARDSYTGSPAADFPLAIPGVPGGTSVARAYYGYHLPTVPEALGKLMDEGLDVYFRPRWASPGVAGWITEANNGWSSGLTREFSVTAPESPVVGFKQRRDGARIMNNSIRVGEGSEVDMLVISNLDTTSTLPLLERVTLSKDVTSTSQLSVMAGQDLISYGEATVQWDLDVLADVEVDVGDTLRLHFDGDPRIPDGFYTRRVVKITGGMGEVKNVSVQKAGGA